MTAAFCSMALFATAPGKFARLPSSGASTWVRVTTLKEWVEAIKKNTVEGIRDYYRTASPSMKVAALMLNEIMLTTGLNDLGHEILEKLRRDIFDEKEMGDEDSEEINFMRGVICGVNFVTYLI